MTIIEMIYHEVSRAKAIHPEWPTSIVEQAAIVAEEAGELVRAANRVKWEQAGTEEIAIEAVQTAAMCVRLLENLIATKEATGYELLAQVLNRALGQASHGKGKQRHANGEPFEDQKICRYARIFGVGAPLAQASKKIEEAHRLGGQHAVQELLGAINYCAAAIIVIEEQGND